MEGRSFLVLGLPVTDGATENVCFVWFSHDYFHQIHFISRKRLCLGRHGPSLPRGYSPVIHRPIKGKRRIEPALQRVIAE